MSDRTVHQPLHPSIIPVLDPEYKAFHESTLQYILPPDTLPQWDPAIRNGPVVPGSSEPLEVARVQDFDLRYTKVRTFTPKGEVPVGGWPVFIWFHGGGWTLGNIASETPFATNMSVRANCVVISVDYRLAPEHPYPAAVEDAIEALDWTVKNGKEALNVNTSRIAVGGSSSGGNLAAILALKAAQQTPQTTTSTLTAPPLIFQLLIVPVTNNTLSIQNAWSQNQHSPWLTPARMTWFKNNYLPNEADRSKWDASPMFAPDELLAALARRTPRAWIGVAGLDILREEGVGYGERLRSVGVDVEVVVYEGTPHPIMAMDGNVLSVGKRLVSDAAAALAKAFQESK